MVVKVLWSQSSLLLLLWLLGWLNLVETLVKKWFDSRKQSKRTLILSFIRTCDKLVLVVWIDKVESLFANLLHLDGSLISILICTHVRTGSKYKYFLVWPRLCVEASDQSLVAICQDATDFFCKDYFLVENSFSENEKQSVDVNEMDLIVRCSDCQSIVATGFTSAVIWLVV